MAYSAVTQPRPLPLRHRGTPSEADAAQRTRVLPNSISTDPAGWSSQLRVILMGRSSSSARPSSRVLMTRDSSQPTGTRLTSAHALRATHGPRSLARRPIQGAPSATIQPRSRFQLGGSPPPGSRLGGAKS